MALENLRNPEDHELAVFLVESYGYFALLSTVRSSVDDDSIRRGLEFSTSILPLIKDLPSFGAMFAFEPGCLSMAPSIARLSQYQDVEAKETKDESYQSLYQKLRANIRSSEPWNVVLGEYTARDMAVQLVKHVKTHALLIFLQATYYRHSKTPADTMEILQPLVDRAVTLLLRVQFIDECYGLLWCFLVVGSFVHDQNDQEALARQYEAIQSTMPVKYKGLKLLRWLWDEPDDREIGLAGLEKVAAEHGVTSFIC